MSVFPHQFNVSSSIFHGVFHYLWPSKDQHRIFANGIRRPIAAVGFHVDQFAALDRRHLLVEVSCEQVYKTIKKKKEAKFKKLSPTLYALEFKFDENCETDQSRLSIDRRGTLQARALAWQKMAIAP